MDNFEAFTFRLPLYSPLTVEDDWLTKAILLGRLVHRVDGHCVECGQNATFLVSKRLVNPDKRGDYLNPNEMIKGYIVAGYGRRDLTLTCTRHPSHGLHFWFDLSHETVVKIGQWPSLADIASDEAASYRSVLSKENASELHRAIGLAAHGVGIGSFVYLRRIFERLINERFKALEEAQSWNPEDFRKLRMDEKVEFLKGHLPEFLVEHRKMYSILSVGIHELSEQDCSAAFEPLLLSLKFILEEDKKKQEEAELLKKASEAIKDFELKR